MFTGIISHIGKIVSIERLASVVRLGVKSDFDSVKLGDSISCSGVCLTVTDIAKDIYYFDISHETLSCTNAGSWAEGYEINLEKAMKMGDEFGGHIVSGHIDCLAEVVFIEQIGESHEFSLKIPANFVKYIITKGSVTLNGVSLTINFVEDDIFKVAIIPYSFRNTTFKNLIKGDKVNLEIDLIARYLEKLVTHRI